MKTILIVDDESRLLQSIQAGLKSWRDTFSVVTALNGQDAISVLREHRIDLVVTDLRMPEVDGFELLAYISKNYPFLPTIVMTAFATPEIEDKISCAGSLVLLEKPLDFDRLAEAIIDGLQQPAGDGSLVGFSLASFMQLLAMEQKTCLLQIETESREEGFIFFENGELLAAVSGDFNGEEAVYRLLAIDNVRLTFRKTPSRRIRRHIDKPLMSLLLEGLRRKDEGEHKENLPDVMIELGELSGQSENGDVFQSALQEDVFLGSKEDQQPYKGDEIMGQLEDSLGKLKDIEGFMAVGIFTPNGEMAAQVNVSGIKIAEVGALANDVLLKAQKATDLMNVGRGQVVHVDAPKAHIIARCLNESEDYAASAAGKAHLHMVLILGKDGNLAMAKIKMEPVIHEVAAAFR
jgi:CheY-like chemotaxis protein